MTDRISTDELRKLLDEHHKGSLYSETLDRHKYDLAAEVIRLREALRKISAGIFNDNGDVTSIGPLAIERIARAALKHKETDNGTS